MTIEPITRKENFLAKAGGQSVEELKPITREEMFLQKIAENGGGSGGGVQPDLSQNDPNAADYVKNRTHYISYSWSNLSAVSAKFSLINDVYYANVSRLPISTSFGTFYRLVDGYNNEILKGYTRTRASDGTTYVGNAALYGRYLGVITDSNPISDEYPDTGEDAYMQTSILITKNLVVPDINNAMIYSPKAGKEIVHKLDKKFLPDDIGGVADWNASEGEDGYVKNRTHYVEKDFAIFADVTTEDNGNIYLDDMSRESLVEGRTYRVIFDGTEYVTRAYYWEWDAEVVVGNSNFNGCTYNINADLPFIIVYYESDGTYDIYTTDEAAHTISLVTDKIIKIPSEYMPDRTIFNGCSPYLCHGMYGQDKVTKEELRLATKSGGFYVVLNWGEKYCLPVCVTVDTNNAYGSVQVWDGTEYKTYYTIEYTS